MKRDVLTRPFEPGQIKQREGQNGKILSYVETHAVIARLNEGCDTWSFEVVHHHVYKAEVVVMGKLIAEGVTKMAFGGSAITVDRNGRVVSIADDLKAAASDALKKCASLLGIGLEFYGGQRAAAPQQPAQRQPASSPANVPRSQVRPSQGSPPASLEQPSEKQIAAIFGSCRRKDISREQLSTLIERRTGKHKVEQLTRREASSLLSELSELNGAHR